MWTGLIWNTVEREPNYIQLRAAVLRKNVCKMAYTYWMPLSDIWVLISTILCLKIYMNI